MYRSFAVALAAFAGALGSSTVHASQLEVTVSEFGLSGISHQVASWTMSQNPTPDYYVTDYYTTVPVFNSTGINNDSDVTWYSDKDDQLGGFTNYSEDFNVIAHVSYASAEATPTFVPGTYYGVDVKPDYSYAQTVYTITVIPDAPLKFSFVKAMPDAPRRAVPEPATWAMMITGLGMIGQAMRRRAKVQLTHA